MEYIEHYCETMNPKFLCNVRVHACMQLQGYRLYQGVLLIDNHVILGSASDVFASLLLFPSAGFFYFFITLHLLCLR